MPSAPQPVGGDVEHIAAHRLQPQITHPPLDMDTRQRFALAAGEPVPYCAQGLGVRTNIADVELHDASQECG
jgi:hypothetical protein